MILGGWVFLMSEVPLQDLMGVEYAPLATKGIGPSREVVSTRGMDRPGSGSSVEEMAWRSSPAESALAAVYQVVSAGRAT